MADESEKLDVEEEIRALNRALGLQLRSVVGYTTAAGSLVGFEYQGLTNQLAEFARAELEDSRGLVEKITSLEGEPTTEVADVRWHADPGDAVDWLIETENETLEALQDAIAPTGREARSEAIEHMLEHVIMRKQNQVDTLLRARRQSASS